jgi:hypothetical protein
MSDNQQLTHGDRVDAIHLMLAKCPPVEMPLSHCFTPGIYSRTIVMPQGSMVISKIHKTEHQYVVLSGEVSVWTEAEGVVHIKAPFVGVTKPGTRRILFVHQTCTWITFHPHASRDVDEIERDIIEPHELPDTPKIDVGPILQKMFGLPVTIGEKGAA